RRRPRSFLFHVLGSPFPALCYFSQPNQRLMTADQKHPAPAWFSRAIQTPIEERFIIVAGCRIHYLLWGKAGSPGLILVHGGFAHAHWWDFIAPLFAQDYRVAALDLSGMG